MAKEAARANGSDGAGSSSCGASGRIRVSACVCVCALLQWRVCEATLQSANLASRSPKREPCSARAGSRLVADAAERLLLQRTAPRRAAPHRIEAHVCIYVSACEHVFV